MRQHTILAVSLVLLALLAPVPAAATGPVIRVYLTTADLSAHLSRQADRTFLPAQSVPPAPLDIAVDETRRYQQIDGFGGALTDSTAWLLQARLTPAARGEVLRRLFDPTHGIGLSYMRLPMGASDFTKDATPYSYDDAPGGHPDPSLAHFSIAHDTAYIIPVLRAALRLNPALKLVASPWSPPGWMKTSATSGMTGTVLPAFYPALAHYVVAFLRAYAAHGVPIDAITPQNEPGQGAGYPGMVFPATAEAAFITASLGPALVAAGLHTRILAYDSYWDTRYTTPNYPFLVMSDAAARRYLSGTAWHCYEGSPDIMTRLHEAYPHKDTYETECSSGIAHGDVAELIIAASRNWSRGTLLWNLALDTSGGPKQGSSCPGCSAPVIVDPVTGKVSYTRDYYQLGQASRFVRPGAYRIASTSPVTHYKGSGLGCRNSTSYGSHTVDDVAFRDTNGSIVVVAYNAAPPAKRFTVRWHGDAFSYTLPPCGTATFTWQSP